MAHFFFAVIPATGGNQVTDEAIPSPLWGEGQDEGELL